MRAIEWNPLIVKLASEMEGRSQVSVTANISILLSFARIETEDNLLGRLLRLRRQTRNLLNLEIILELFTTLEIEPTRLTSCMKSYPYA